MGHRSHPHPRSHHDACARPVKGGCMAAPRLRTAVAAATAPPTHSRSALGRRPTPPPAHRITTCPPHHRVPRAQRHACVRAHSTTHRNVRRIMAMRTSRRPRVPHPGGAGGVIARPLAAWTRAPRSWRRLQVRPSPRACDRAPRAAAARPCCWTSWTSWMSRAAGAVAAPAACRSCPAGGSAGTARPHKQPWPCGTPGMPISWPSSRRRCRPREPSSGCG
mmetsp:Transcript_15097/g.40527  ORF Transcript_15097/g.40527 Transcript_15097/m.40527 type:complete len:220 (+) Transcript_15097:447-1106(+)